MSDAPQPSPRIHLSLTTMGDVCSFFAGPRPWGLALVFIGVMTAASSLVPAATSEDQEFLRSIAIYTVVAIVSVGIAEFAARRYLRDVERAVLELVQREGPMRRTALLKACRNEPIQAAVLLSTERLVAAGRLTHSSKGYIVSDTDSPQTDVDPSAAPHP